MESFRIGEWAVRPAEGTVTGASQTVRFEPKVMAVFVCLADRAGEVVSRNDLLDEVWRDTHVSEVALSRCISAIRRELGDDAKNPRLIETIPKRGYRLLAPVAPLIETSSPASTAATEAAAPALATTRPWQRRLLLPIVAALLVAVIALAVLLGGTDEVDPASVAVLPFQNLSSDPESDYFSAGITEDITATLGKIRDLKVVSRTTMMRYRESGRSIGEIGRELRVATVLEGSVRRQGKRVRIVAQLIDVASDDHLWAETYDRDLDDIFDIQQRVAERIAAALEAKLTAAERGRLRQRPTAEVSAYDYYLRGREHYRRYRREENEAAIAQFQQALALDPDFALAHAGLASAYVQRVVRYDGAPHWLDTALASAQRARDLDADLPEAHKALGLTFAAKGWPHRAAEAYERAIALRPGYDEAVHNFGLLLYTLKDWDEAGRYRRPLVDLAPR